jgi:dolichyl-phosphate-mannose-protein mannosyltransferase
MGPLTPSLLRAIGVFVVVAFSSWGLGDLLIATFRLPCPSESRWARPLLALAIGCGALGDALLFAGLVGDAYQAPIVGGALLVLALVALFRVSFRGALAWCHLPMGLGVFGWITVVLAVVYIVQWGWVSLGFNPGSDVFSHHYLDVKYMVYTKHFGYQPSLPSGTPHVSSYNPALARMLWLPGHLLADERASNMFHWLTQVMLLGGLYVLGRILLSARAGLLAVALYLTTGMLGYYPLEAQDYTLIGVYLLLTVLMVVMALRDKSVPAIVLAGVLAGFMLSTKYYAIPLTGLIAAAIVLWEPSTWKTRIRPALLFGTVAVAVYLPWMLYNVVRFHDPLAPLFFQTDAMRFERAVYWVHTLSPFVVKGDRGFLVPTFLYYTSLFIPFEPGSASFGLSVMFLIGLPCSMYCLFRYRTSAWRGVHVLFVVAVAGFVALHVLIGHLAFYKWSFFPAVLYACSLGSLVERLKPAATRAFWTGTLMAAGLNYWFIALPRIQKITPPVKEQQARWGEMTQYLNATLEPHAVVTGASGTIAYYLRPDVTGLWDDDLASTDWATEGAQLRRLGVRYVLLAPQNQPTYDMLYKFWSDLWRQLSPDDASMADYIEDIQRRQHRRNRDKAQFLAEHAMLIHSSSDGQQLYRLNSREYP